MKSMSRYSGNGQFGIRITVITFLIFITGGYLPAYAGSTIPVMVGHFNISDAGAVMPSGITYSPETGNYAITDSTNRNVYIVDPDGVLQNQFATDPLVPSGQTHPQGITCITTGTFAGNYAIADDHMDEVFIVSKNGELRDNFDTSSFGAANPMGIAYITSGSLAGSLAIIDYWHGVYILNCEGEVQLQFDTGFLESTPRGVTFCASSGCLAIVDAHDNVYVVDCEGVVQRRFNIGFVSQGVGGISYNPDTGELVAADSHKECFVFNLEGEFFASFSTALFGSTSPVGITAVLSSGDFAVVDDAGDEVFFVNSQGDLQGSCDISGFSDRAGGITYIPSTGDFAIADYSKKKIFIIDSKCGLRDQFDIGRFGINSTAPSGIALLPAATDKFAVSDQGYYGRVVTVDITRPGKTMAQFSTPAVKSLLPTGICLVPSPAYYAITDSSADGVFVVDPRGILRARFSTSLFSRNPQGIAYNPDTEVFAIVDSDNDAAYLLQLPGLVIPPGPQVCEGDLDRNGDVDGRDLSLFTADFGRIDCSY